MLQSVLSPTVIGIVTSFHVALAIGQTTDMAGRCGRDVAYKILSRFSLDTSFDEVTDVIGGSATITLEELDEYLRSKGLETQAKWLPIEHAPKLEQWMRDCRRQLAVVLVVPPIQTGHPHHAVLVTWSGELGFESIEPGTEALRRYEWKAFESVGALPMLWVLGDAYRVSVVTDNTQVVPAYAPRSSLLLAIVATLILVLAVAPHLRHRMARVKTANQPSTQEDLGQEQQWLLSRQWGLVLSIPLVPPERIDVA